MNKERLHLSGFIMDLFPGLNTAVMLKVKEIKSEDSAHLQNQESVIPVLLWEDLNASFNFPS